MRFPHWLKSVASAFVLSATAGSVMAQGPGYPGSGQPMFQPAYPTNDPGVLYPQGVPQGYQPYPAISPYGMGNVGWDQTFRDDDGLWFRRLMNTNREYFGSIDVTHNTIKNPGHTHLGSAFIPYDTESNGLLGFEIPTYGQGATPGTATTGGGATATATIPTSRVIVDRRVLPYPALVVGTTVTFIPDNRVFPIRDLGAFDNFRSGGLAANWGFFNEDGTGMSVGGFWASPSQQSFQMGQDSINGVPITQSLISTLDGSLLFTRNGAIPLDWGFSNPSTQYNGVANLGTAKYDLLFAYDTKTSAIGTDANFYMTPMIQREAVKVRSFIGGRYMHIDDQFHFRGIDSGFGYTITAATGGGGGGGATTGNTFRPATGTLQANYALYEATLTNNVRTNLAGPQVGLRYDLGDGDEFKLWGQSVVGLMANREDYRQFGNNIGDQQGLLLFSNGLDMLATDARFQSRRTVTHVSPLFEQTFMAEMKILDMIPGVRRLPYIEDTVFRVGYTATVVGGIARAGDSIDWKGFPLTPSIRPGRDTWWMSRWNFGVEKRF